MPIPPFVSGETLSAMRLNQMVDIINRAQRIMTSISHPFEQVEVADNGTFTWQWMFRYAPEYPFWRVRYQWTSRHASAYLTATLAGNTLVNDAAGGASGVHNYSPNIASLGLIPGSVYTVDMTVNRGASGSWRLTWLFNSNNSSYAPTIIQ